MYATFSIADMKSSLKSESSHDWCYRYFEAPKLVSRTEHHLQQILLDWYLPMYFALLYLVVIAYMISISTKFYLHNLLFLIIYHSKFFRKFNQLSFLTLIRTLVCSHSPSSGSQHFLYFYASLLCILPPCEVTQDFLNSVPGSFCLV